MTRRVALRAALLVAVALGLLVGLTAYFSSEKVPPCLVSGAPRWDPPQDGRFLLVVPDRALCFYAADSGHRLVGAVALDGIRGVTAIEPRGKELAVRYGDGRGALVDLVSGRTRPASPPPPPSDDLLVVDPKTGVEYTTRPGRLGFHVDGRPIAFDGFTWSPKFGPDPPDRGLSLAPDRRELWVVDAPNSVVHVFDIAGVPRRLPKQVADVRLSKQLSGDESPCAPPRCERLGSLLHSADGRFVYVGDAGDVIDAGKRAVVLNLEALHQSRLMLEVDWVDGRPQFPR